MVPASISPSTRADLARFVPSLACDDLGVARQVFFYPNVMEVTRRQLREKQRSAPDSSFLTDFGGVAVVQVTALILGRMHAAIPITGKIMSRAAPNLMDLMICI